MPKSGDGIEEIRFRNHESFRLRLSRIIALPQLEHTEYICDKNNVESVENG